MAEGGHDPDETGTFDPNEGADERTPFIPHHSDEMEMKDRTSTPFSSTSKHRTHETSFIDGTPSGVMREREESQDKAAEMIKELFPNTDTSRYFAKIEKGVIYVKLKGIKNVWYPILSEDGDVLFDKGKKRLPKTLRNALGQDVFEKVAMDWEINEKVEERIRELRNHGLKELGTKLGQILPGMVGAIASFIFRTAGEVIGFLAKNAWLLVVGLVLLAVEQLKNKKK